MSTDISIVHPWDPWQQGAGGFDTCLDGILRALPENFEVELIGTTADQRARPCGSWLRREFAGRPVRFKAVIENRRPSRAPSLPLSLRFYLACRRQRVSAAGRIVEFHRFESAMAFAPRPDQPRFLFLHNHPPEHESSDLSDVRWRHLPSVHRRLLLGEVRRSTTIVGVDPRTPAWISRQAPAVDTLPLPQWADSDQFRPAENDAERLRGRKALRSELALEPEVEIVTLVARLERQKDPLLLVEAFARALRLNPRLALLIVGEGRLEDPIARLAGQLGLEGRLRRRPSVGRDEIAAIYRASDVTVCSSAYESGPRSVFESLACGTPAVTFELGQAAELMRESPAAGVLVPRRSADALAAAIQKGVEMASDPATAVRCLDAVRGRSAKTSLKRVLDCYRAVVDGPATVGPALSTTAT